MILPASSIAPMEDINELIITPKCRDGINNPKHLIYSEQKTNYIQFLQNLQRVSKNFTAREE